MDLEPESFRGGGGGGEAIGGRTGGPAYTETDPAPLGFTGSSKPEDISVDRSNLYHLFMEVFKFLLLATVVTILGVFALGFIKGRTVNAGLNALKNVFAK
jgi:hypothetical protein